MGVYERMVGVAKRALESLCHYSDLTVDEFLTVAYKVANLVYSRPLSILSLSEGDIILTPNHFLLGNLGGSLTTETLPHIPKGSLFFHCYFSFKKKN